MTDRVAFSVEEAAQRASLSRSQLYLAISSGELRTLKVGKRRLVRPEALREWLQKLEQSTGRPGA